MEKKYQFFAKKIILLSKQKRLCAKMEGGSQYHVVLVSIAQFVL
jgi:hypothetical protein